MTASAKTVVPNQLKAEVEEVAMLAGADAAAAAKTATGKVANSRQKQRRHRARELTNPDIAETMRGGRTEFNSQPLFFRAATLQDRRASPEPSFCVDFEADVAVKVNAIHAFGMRGQSFQFRSGRSG
jgi:hypothetical protein